jgi:hypothetical protein
MLLTATHSYLSRMFGAPYNAPVLVPKAIAWLAALGMLIAATFLLAGLARAKSYWRFVGLVPIILASWLWYQVAPSGIINSQFQYPSWAMSCLPRFFRQQDSWLFFWVRKFEYDIHF